MVFMIFLFTETLLEMTEEDSYKISKIKNVNSTDW